MIERLAVDKETVETMTARGRDYGEGERENFIGFRDERD